MKMIFRRFSYIALICALVAIHGLSTAPAQDSEPNSQVPQQQGYQSLGEGGREFDREEGHRGMRDQQAPRVSNPMFEAIDTDGDGVISPRELRRAAAALKVLDIDGDGYITLEEATQPLGEPSPTGRLPRGDEDYSAEMNQRIDQIMAENDRNGDGVLSRDEVGPQLAQILQAADLNGDGVIDRDELGAALQNMWNQGGAPGQGPFEGEGQFGAGGGFRGLGGGNSQQLLRRILQFDRNGDGVLTPDEIPAEFRGLLGNADLNGDGRLDAREIRAALEKARQRLGNQREDQRGYNPANRPAVNPGGFQRGRQGLNNPNQP